MSIPRSSLDGSFPDNSEFQLTDSLKSQEDLNKKVIQGTAKEAKSNVLTTARDTLLYHDGESIGSTVMDTVVAPAVRELSSNIVRSIFDMILESIDRIIFKDDPVRQHPTRYQRGGNGYVPYGSIFSSNPSGYYNVSPNTSNFNRNVNNPTNFTSPLSTSIMSVCNIIFEPDPKLNEKSSRGRVDAFIDDLLFTVNQYQSISVANVKAKLEWPSQSQDTKWGWTPATLNPNTIIKRRMAGGAWRVMLPKPEALDI